MKQKPAIKTPAEVRAEFERRGISISSWANAHDVGKSLVYGILSSGSKRTCSRGQSHKVAVLLGLKEGEITDSPKVMNVSRSIGGAR